MAGVPRLVSAQPARTGEGSARLGEALAAIRVRDVMTPDPVIEPGWCTIKAFLEEYVLRHRHSALPIRNLHGELQGLVTPARLKTVPGNLRAATRVAEVECPVAKALGLSKEGARAHQGSVPAQPGGHDRPLDDDRTDLMEVTVTQDVELAGRRLGTCSAVLHHGVPVTGHLSSAS